MAEIEGTVTLDSVAAEVPVIALARVGGEYQILDSTISAPDGTYGLDPGGAAFIVALGGNGAAHGAVSGAALWTPAEITTALWLDASDAATITESGGAVSAWADKATSVHSIAAASGAPTTGVRTQNGLNTLYFDGNDELGDLSGAASSTYLSDGTEHQIYLVAKADGADPNRPNPILATRDDSPSSRGIFLGFEDRASFSWNDTAFHLVNNGSGYAVNARPANGLLASNQFQLVALESAPASVTAANRSYLYASGGVASQTNTQTLSPSALAPVKALRIGRHGGSSVFLVGEIAEIIIVVGAADTATRQLIEGYLAWKWGLQANLPSGHPYKDAAPTV